MSAWDSFLATFGLLLGLASATLVAIVGLVAAVGALIWAWSKIDGHRKRDRIATLTRERRYEQGGWVIGTYADPLPGRIHGWLDFDGPRKLYFERPTQHPWDAPIYLVDAADGVTRRREDGCAVRRGRAIGAETAADRIGAPAVTVLRQGLALDVSTIRGAPPAVELTHQLLAHARTPRFLQLVSDALTERASHDDFAALEEDHHRMVFLTHPGWLNAATIIAAAAEASVGTLPGSPDPALRAWEELVGGTSAMNARGPAPMVPADGAQATNGPAR